MNIHEYQAKQIFRDAGIPVPRGHLAHSPTEAEFIMRRMKAEKCVVKAQVHAGGRGKAGGVKLVSSPEECFKVAKDMIGMKIVTKQTGEEGKLVRKVYIEEASKIEKEHYLAMLVDRESAEIAIIFSTEGGMDIEEVAEKTPEKIKTVKINPVTGLCGHHIRQFIHTFNFSKEMAKNFSKVIQNLYTLFQKKDYSLLEINPLMESSDGNLIALDGKMNFDENALFRHQDIMFMRDFDEEDAREVEASKSGLSYIGLEGNIGCLVNGAGLAMATMDIIKHYGGEPANFLDVGGGATEQQVKNAFEIILSDEHVKAIFVNIFGGIMQCDVLAKGIVAAANDLGLKVPLVVRLEGTNVEQGRAILKDSGLNIINASDMADGAEKAVKAIK